MVRESAARRHAAWILPCGRRGILTSVSVASWPGQYAEDMPENMPGPMLRAETSVALSPCVLVR